MKYQKPVIEIVFATIIILLLIFFCRSAGIAEKSDYTEAYILCVDYVNVRPFPNRKGEPVGRLESGDRVWLDGKKRNGFLHIVDTGMESDGWVYKGFVVYDEPERIYQTAVIVSRGRLAARKYVNGRRTRWLKPKATLRVYYWSDDWCVTNCGYVQSRYLELVGE